ncbi:unnamed protein product [Schistosoma intercalatum]|nr:unnamed protein product [Schistosoma intercalatum]CAH8609724.1 unnamed protein product [Schistosoma intercalatum]
MYDFHFLLLLIGDSCVGKTSLLIRFKDGIFIKGSYISTVGIDYKTKTVKANDQLVRLQIWDTAGQEKFRSLTKSYYRDTNAVLLVYDICKMDSFSNIKSWMSEINANIQSNNNNILIILVGNKLDEEKNRMVTKKEGERLAQQTDALFWETSAKTGANVDSMFHCIAERLLEIQTPICTISSTNSTQQSNGYSTTINEIHNSISSNQSFKLNHSTKPLRNCCSS